MRSARLLVPVLAVLFGAALLAAPARAATVPAPPVPKLSVVVTQLNLVHGHTGYLTVQPQIDPGTQNPFWQIVIARSIFNDAPALTGYWQVEPIVVDAVHNVTCANFITDGDINYWCRPTVGTTMPSGRFLMTIPITRVGRLTVYSGRISALYEHTQLGAGDSFPIVDSSVSPTSTGEVRQVRLDPVTGQTSIAINLQITKSNEVDSFALTLGLGWWRRDSTHAGKLQGLSCYPANDGRSSLGATIKCQRLDGASLPVGTISVVIPVFRVGGPAFVKPYPPYEPLWGTGSLQFWGPPYAEDNRTVDSFLVG